MAPHKRGTASKAGRSAAHFTSSLNQLYRRSWRHLVAASSADVAGDRERVRRELSALHATLGRFLTHT